MSPSMQLDLGVSGTASSISHAAPGGKRSNSLRSVDRQSVSSSPAGGGYAGDGALLPESPSRKGSMVRAKDWTPQVEDFYRLQFCGWRDEEEYRSAYGEPERWSQEQGGFISKVQLKSNGYFTYWRKWRECEEKHVNRVKVYA
jgi:hypothetical protein